MDKKDMWVQVERDWIAIRYYYRLVTQNGILTCHHQYESKTECSNDAKSLADALGIEFRQ